MKKLRIVFMGTPDFAVTILDTIIKHNYQVVGVITAPDKEAGRGRKIQQSAVKQYAVTNNLPVLQPINLKSESFLQELKELAPDIQVVVAFRMLPKSVWSLPKHGTFNLHASLLPDYRGAAPINWAIINGETETGTTTFFLDDKIDTGEIILQNKTNISPTETVGELHDKLMHLGSKLVIETLELLENNHVTTHTQPESSPKLAYKIFTETCRIDWNQPLNKIYNLIRGLNPYPGAWTTIVDNNKEITAKIYGCKKIVEQHSYEIGTIITNKKELFIATKDGLLQIETLKIEGKKLMDTASLLNGYTFNKKAKAI